MPSDFYTCDFEKGVLLTRQLRSVNKRHHLIKDIANGTEKRKEEIKSSSTSTKV